MMKKMGKKGMSQKMSKKRLNEKLMRKMANNPRSRDAKKLQEKLRKM